MKKKKILCLILLIVLIILIILFHLLNIDNNAIQTNKISDTQSDIFFESRNEITTGTTDFYGSDEIRVSEKHPCVELVNLDSNDVYFKYSVYLNDQLIKETDLISPGKMERLNIYELLDKGEYTLDYFITTYDVDQKTVLLSNINQKQKIIIT